MGGFPNVTGPLNQSAAQNLPRTGAPSPARETPPAAPAASAPQATTALPAQNVVNVGGPRPESAIAPNSVSFNPPKAPNSSASLDAALSDLDPHGEVRQFVQAVRTAPSGPAPQLNLNNGVNYNVSQLFAQTDSGNVNNITQALNRASSGAAPSEADAQALRSIGLMVHDGGVYNLANQQKLTTQDLGNMAQLANTRLTSLTSTQVGARILNQTGAERELGSVERQLSLASANLDALKEMQGLIEQNTTQIASRRKDLEDNDQAILAQRDVADQSVTTAEVEDAKLDYLEDVREHIVDDGAEPLSTPETLDRDNAKLADFGLKIVSDGGTMRLADSTGTVLSPEESRRRLDVAVDRQRDTAETARATARTETAKLGTLTERSAQLAGELETLLDRGLALDENFQARDAAVQAELAGIHAETPEQQSQLDALRRRGHEISEQGNRLRERFQQERGHATRALTNTRQLQAMIRGMLPALGDRLVRSIANMNLLPNQNTLTPPNVELLREMLSRVAEAEATLNLAPRPATVDVQKMVTEWSDMLREYSARFDKDTKSQNDNKQVQTTFSATQQRDLRRAMEHHGNQLKKLDANNLERTEQALRAALQGLYQQASASLPVTSAGNR